MSATGEPLIRAFLITSRPFRSCRSFRSFRPSEEDRLAIASIDLLEHMPDFVQRAVRTGTVQHGGYDVAILCCRTPEGVQPLGHQALVALRAHPSHPFSLDSFRLVADLEDLDRGL